MCAKVFSECGDNRMNGEMFVITEEKAKYILTMSQLLNSIRINKELTPEEVKTIKDFAVDCIRSQLTHREKNPV